MINIKVLITIVFIFDQITDSSDIDTSTDCFRLTNGSCEKRYQASRRFPRQAGNNFCIIPSHSNTLYKIQGPGGYSYGPGDRVPAFSILSISCDDGYKVKPLSNPVSVCLNGAWSSQDLSCFRACQSLASTNSTEVTCTYNERLLDNCHSPIDDTTVYLKCNDNFEEPNIFLNPVHLCSEGEWIPPLIQCKPICGVKRPVANKNIIGENAAVEGDYPWQIAVYKGDEHEFICGGSLIDRRIVLSAAHCFTDYSGNVNPASSYEVSAGKYYRSYEDREDKFAQNSKIRSIHIHERYKGDTSFQAFDLAVLILRDPFVISRQVQPVCIELNEISTTPQLSSNAQGLVVGWGYTQEGRVPSNVLKEARIPIVSYSTCYDNVPVRFRPFITSDKICGGYIDRGISVCAGDSGGGLVIENVITKKYYIKGIVSTSPSTEERQCDSNQYSLYTSISSHLKFVRNLVLRNQWKETIECAIDGCTITPPMTDTEIEDKNSKYAFVDDRCCDSNRAYGIDCTYRIYGAVCGRRSLVKRLAEIMF